jgi:hypothetical protein
VAIAVLIALYTFIIYPMIHQPINPHGRTLQSENTIISPTTGDVLVKGQTYTLSWTGGDPGETQIFLIDTALESAGVSVSISDRVYHIQNTGSYQYTVPKRLPDGIYKFEIGDQTSNTFQIVSR